ncbi:MAG: SufD family Fe-S cluster assembly protein [Desulfobulbaceae bacterium]
MSEIDLKRFLFDGPPPQAVGNLESLAEGERERLLMSGIDSTETGHSATFLHLDRGGVYCNTRVPGLEVCTIQEALDRYGEARDFLWQLVDPEQDPFTRTVRDSLQGGYFVRVARGVRIPDPVQSCLFMKTERVGQSVHNLIILEEGAEVHIVTGCVTSRRELHGAHLGVTELYVGKRARLTLTMIHNWGENVYVRPRSAGVVDEGGVVQNNYILLTPVRSLQMDPVLRLDGRGARCRFNSVMVAPPGSHVDVGGRVFLNAPETAAEIISRSVTTGGAMHVRGLISGNAAPARGHLECRGLILGGGTIHAVPELEGRREGLELSHEAAVGRIARDELEYLMARGLDEEEAVSTIVRGFLNVDIMGLPVKLRAALDDVVGTAAGDSL